MAISVRSSVRGVGRVGAPVLKALGLSRAMVGVETYLAFLSGRGGGSGWDMAGQTKVIAAFVAKGPATIIDVGANNGEWSRLLAQTRREPGDRFHLFECAPYCFDAIERRRDQIPNLQLEKLAVSDHAGTAVLHLPTQGSGLASLHERKDVCVVPQSYVPHEVQTIRLDDYFHEAGIERVQLLKIDIEGHELHAIKGAQVSMEKGMIDTVVFEFGSANINSRSFFLDFWTLFTDAGYRLYRIIPGGRYLEVPIYSETLEYFRGSTNYIASRVKPRL